MVVPRARRGRAPRVRRVVTGLAVVAALAVPPTTTALAAPSAPTGPQLVPPPARYLEQEIAWVPCLAEEELAFFPDGSDRLECGTYTAPRDWEAPDASGDLTLAVSRLPAQEGEAERSVLVNPGGPGAPGLFLPVSYLELGRERLTDAVDIVGFDVRGTGSSTNITCAGASALGLELDPRDRSEANTTLILDAAETTARYCQAADPDLSPLISTEQTVQDLDLLRALLARESVDWIGYSAGTWLGAAYATYFPDRVGRFVLDGNVEFTADWQDTFARDGFAFERRFRVDFLPWVARYEERFGLGGTAEEVRAVYEEVRAGLAVEPVDVGGGLLVGPALLDNIIAGSLYSKLAFTDAADLLGALAELRSGEVADVRDGRLRALVERAPQRALDSFDATFLHTVCNDSPWEGDRASLLQFSAEQGAQHPLVGYSLLYSPCTSWDLPEAAVLAPRTGAGVPPVLMVNNERDPATPIEGALVARQFFAGARLLVVEDEGDHTVYPGNDCVDEKVEDFLLGEAEAEDSTCQGEGLPEPAEPFDPSELGEPDGDDEEDSPSELAQWYAGVASR